MVMGSGAGTRGVNGTPGVGAGVGAGKGAGAAAGVAAVEDPLPQGIAGKVWLEMLHTRPAKFADMASARAMVRESTWCGRRSV